MQHEREMADQQILNPSVEKWFKGLMAKLLADPKVGKTGALLAVAMGRNSVKLGFVTRTSGKRKRKKLQPINN